MTNEFLKRALNSFGDFQKNKHSLSSDKIAEKDNNLKTRSRDARSKRARKLVIYSL